MATAHVQVNTRIPADLYEKLAARAKAEERSLTAVVNRALREHLTPAPTNGEPQ